MQGSPLKAFLKVIQATFSYSFRHALNNALKSMALQRRHVCECTQTCCNGPKNAPFSLGSDWITFFDPEDVRPRGCERTVSECKLGPFTKAEKQLELLVWLLRRSSNSPQSTAFTDVKDLSLTSTVNHQSFHRDGAPSEQTRRPRRSFSGQISSCYLLFCPSSAETQRILVAKHGR